MYDTEFTVEHVVPISKGGTNIPINLIALCKSCNVKKTDDIITPSLYYKYLPDSAKKEVQSYYELYINNEKWLTPKNYLKQDVCIIPYTVRTRMYNSKLSKRTRAGVNIHEQVIRATLRKMKYGELDEAYNVLEKYSDIYNLPKEDIKETLASVFKTGAIYSISNASGIIALIPFMIKKIKFGETYGYAITIPGIPHLYEKPHYEKLISDAILKIATDIAVLNSKGTSIIQMVHPENDQFLERIARMLRGCFSSKAEGWKCDFILAIDASQENREEKAKKWIETADKEKIFAQFSQFLEKEMELKEYTASPNEKKKKKTTKVKEEITEYDPEYYGLIIN